MRPLAADDVEAVRRVQNAAFAPLDAADFPSSDPTEADSPAVASRQRARIVHFLEHDPDGSWVADVDGQVVGAALALRRGDLWGLSLLVVDPPVQSRGVGRQLLGASLQYAEGAARAIILSSRDPRAMRRYAKAGFDLHPQVVGTGRVDRASLPALGGRVRDGGAADTTFADDVDAAVRGARRGPDHELLAAAWAMFVVDDADGRGYAYVRDDGDVVALAAGDDDTAAALLWRCLAHTMEQGCDAVVDHVTGNQQWAIRVAVAAGLALRPGGPVFWRGAAPPPAYLPSGAFL